MLGSQKHQRHFPGAGLEWETPQVGHLKSLRRGYLDRPGQAGSCPQQLGLQ